MASESNKSTDRIDYWLERERVARHAAAQAGSSEECDGHLMMAERCADRAWSLGEEEGAMFVPSTLWCSSPNEGRIAA